MGLRLHGNNGTRNFSTADREEVPDEILGSDFFANEEDFELVGAGEMCVGVREGRFFADACLRPHRFLCTHTYSGNC